MSNSRTSGLIFGKAVCRVCRNDVKIWLSV